MDARVRVARLSVGSNLTLVVFKLAAALLMGSVSVMSEAIHSGLDLIAALIALISVHQASRPADEIHNFGHGKIENISGTIEGLLVLAASVWIIIEAVNSFRHGVQVEAVGIGMLIMLVSAVVNFFISRRLAQVARETDSVALEADALHLRTDVYTSLGVMAGLGLIKLTGYHFLDSLAAVVVALLIAHAAIRLTKKAFVPLTDVRLPVDEEQVIINIIEKYDSRFVEYHKLRTRKAGAERHIDLHLVVPARLPLNQAHDLCHEIETEIKRQFPTSHILIHYEPCNDGCDKCRSGMRCQ